MRFPALATRITTWFTKASLTLPRRSRLRQRLITFATWRVQTRWAAATSTWCGRSPTQKRSGICRAGTGLRIPSTTEGTALFFQQALPHSVQRADFRCRLCRRARPRCRLSKSRAAAISNSPGSSSRAARAAAAARARRAAAGAAAATPPRRRPPAAKAAKRPAPRAEGPQRWERSVLAQSARNRYADIMFACPSSYPTTSRVACSTRFACSEGNRGQSTYPCAQRLACDHPPTAPGRASRLGHPTSDIRKGASPRAGDSPRRHRYGDLVTRIVAGAP